MSLRPAKHAPPARVVISTLQPSVDNGFHPARRVVGDLLEVRATVCADGHDVVGARVVHRLCGPDDDIGDDETVDWAATPMRPGHDNRFSALVPLDGVGTLRWCVEAWIDVDATWARRIERRKAAGLPTDIDEADAAAAHRVAPVAHLVRSAMRSVLVETELAAFSAWYEFFPRSTLRPAFSNDVEAGGPLRHGTLREAVDRLPAIAELGFDIVYLPPIHPIGRSHRKGRNNSVTSTSDDVGSPWAIGDKAGGHTAVHPELGTVADVERLAEEARSLGMELALDIAFQCSPDHPWIDEHPEWFAVRSDGSIAHAENAPKMYEDIVPFDFDTPDWPNLWSALADVVRFWRAVGVRVFRVDNPHTKPFPFWEWLLAEMRREDPNTIFLAEAFAMPSVMTHLAKIGFTQSYDHFPWQHTPSQIREYFGWVTAPENREHLRASSWPNTPDILTEHLQQGLRGAFVERLVLAGTLSASYGIYGPAFETMQSRARLGAEEYLDNEKYELREWHDVEGDLRPEIRALNIARRTHRALQHDRTLHFHRCDNERIVVFSKTAPLRTEPAADGMSDDPVVVVVSMDQWNPHIATVSLDLDVLGDGPWHDYEVEDLLTGDRFRWSGGDNVVVLGPTTVATHVFAIRTEKSGEAA